MIREGAGLSPGAPECGSALPSLHRLLGSEPAARGEGAGADRGRDRAQTADLNARTSIFALNLRRGLSS